MRKLAACLVLVALAGCGKSVRSCKKGTILLTVTAPDGTDQLQLSVSVDASALPTQTVAMPAGTTRGTIELDFSSYPAGRSVLVDVTAFSAGNVLGTGESPAKTAAATCDTISVGVDSSGGGTNDLGVNTGGDGGGGCQNATDCPMGMSCDVLHHKCSMQCSDGQPCNGGCCSAGVCGPGTTLDKCGASGGACATCTTGQACQNGACGLSCSATEPCNGGCCDSVQHKCVTGTAPDQCALGNPVCNSCSGKSAGSACIANGTTNACGCNGPSDCPVNTACNLTTHTCGPACTSTQPCNGGCCSAASGGTCQTGTLVSACGANGGVCGDCSANANGHLCVPITGGGQCGCNNVGSDCPATSSACTGNLCINSCSSTTTCASGCCTAASNGVCNPGTATGTCGTVGSLCQDCATNANGHVCLATKVCGCTKAADCPSGQACDTGTSKCTTACNSNQPCNAGCCSAASGGTCVAGTSTSACGSNGGVCAPCPANSQCTTYSCNGSCVATQLTSACDDGNLCTYNDTCNGAGACVGSQSNCPPSNDCNTYTCNGGPTCDHSINTGALCGRQDNCCTGGPETCGSDGLCKSNGCCNARTCCGF